MRKHTIKNQLQSKYYYILSCLDRDPYSKTYGCFDRLYWGWKLKDYSDLTLQRMVYPLAKMLHNNNLLDTEHLGWIEASFCYIADKVHDDGSVDQAFYGEHSHAGTGFLLFDLLNTFDLIQSFVDTQTASMIQNLLHKMASYLLSHDETHGFISNHLLGVAAALTKMHQLSGEFRYLEKAKTYIDRVISTQTSDGWFPEYNGPDPGYQSLAIYYLGSIYKITQNQKYQDALYKAIDFTSYFIHPNGSYGGEYGSRNTEIFYPGGYALLYDDFELAKNIIDFMVSCIETHCTVTLDSIDDGNLAPLINNYLLLDEIKYSKAAQQDLLPFQRVFSREFCDIGIIIHSNQNYYAIINLFKGGIVKSFSKTTGELLIDHCGFVLKEHKKIYTTQQQNSVPYQYLDNRIIANVAFYELNQPLPNSFNMLILKLIFMIIQKNYILREFIKQLLAKMLISKRKAPYVTLPIEIALTDDTVKLCLSNSIESSTIKGFKKFSAIHMASSKYY